MTCSNDQDAHDPRRDPPSAARRRPDGVRGGPADPRPCPAQARARHRRHAGGAGVRRGLRHAGGASRPRSHRRMVRRLGATPRRDARHRVRRRSRLRHHRNAGVPAVCQQLRLLLGLFRQDQRAFPGADAAVPGRDGRLHADPRPLQPVRLVRGHERDRLRADRLQAGRLGDRRCAQLHRHQFARRLHDAGRHRADLFAGRRARFLLAGRARRRQPARSGDRRRLLPGRLRPADQGGDGAVPLLAQRRPRGGALAGLRDLLRRDGWRSACSASPSSSIPSSPATPMSSARCTRSSSGLPASERWSAA